MPEPPTKVQRTNEEKDDYVFYEGFDAEKAPKRNYLGYDPQPNGHPIMVDEGSVLFGFDELEEFMVKAFIAAEVPEEDAKICAEVLIDADKHGIDSHGAGRLKLIYLDRIANGTQNPETNFDIVKQTAITAVVDGHNGMGHVISKKACDMAIEMAKEHGLGMVAVRNSTHFGNCGYYARRMTEAGLIGMVNTNARPSIPPTHSTEPMVGTNPLVFCVPTDEPFPWINDYGTAIYQRGMLEKFSRSDKKTPAGAVIGLDGEYRTDTKGILKDLKQGKAACLAVGGFGELLGGYKGFGFAMVTEFMSTVLQNGNHMRTLRGFDKEGNPQPIELGHCFLCVNPEMFDGLDVCRAKAGQIIRELRAARKAPGCTRIFTHGEKEYLAKLERGEAGGTLVPPGLQAVLNQVRERYEIEYTFPWDE
ncbi:hypothetical protein PCE1_002217 [Barthelona sp. PCE]